MTTKDFINKVKTIDPLLQYLEVIADVNYYFTIDDYPNYDYFPYKGEVGSNYYFRNSIDFSDYFYIVLSTKCISQNIIDAESWEDICAQLSIPHSKKNRCFISSKDFNRLNLSIDEDGYGQCVNDFNLHKFDIVEANNDKKLLIYEGSFSGDSSDIETSAYVILSEIRLRVIKQEINRKPFYMELISESYLLYQRCEYKLSFFTLYSALESYINYSLGSNEDEVRLKEKIQTLFKSKFIDLNKCQIYSPIIEKFNEFTKKRNIIAHGRDKLVISKTDVENIFFVVSIFIISCENKIDNYDALYKLVEEFC